MPAAIAAAALPFGSARPLSRTVPDVRLSMPKTARATSERPAPTSPASATISPLRTLKEMSWKTPSLLRFATSSTTSPGVVSVLGNSASRSRPTIERMMSSMVSSLDRRGAHEPAVAHDRHPLAAGEDLFEPVRDEQHRRAVRAQGLDDVEQAQHLDAW